jgi:hypothetical protein
VEVVIDGARGTDSWCIFPVVDHSFPIGVFPSGEYVVTVSYRFQTILGQFETEHLGDLPLTIQGSPPQPVPSIGWSAMSVLIIF